MAAIVPADRRHQIGGRSIAIGADASDGEPLKIGVATKITLLSCALFTLLTGASISPALPAIRAAFSDDPNAELLTKLVLTISPLFIAIGGPIVGWLIDRWRRVPVLAAAIVGTAVFGAAGAFMDSLWGLIASRALLGLAVAGVTNTCYTLMVDYFDGEERHRFMGLQAAVQKGGGLVFVLLGGILAAISWRAPFLVDLIALLVLPAALLALPEPKTRKSASTEVDRPKLPWKIVTIVWLVGFFGQAVFFTIPTQIPFILTDKLDAPPQMVGLAIATSTLFSVLTASLYHRFKARLGFAAIFGLMSFLVGGSFYLLSQAGSLAAFFVALALGGLGFGLLLPNMTIWLAENTPAMMRGRAMGVMMTAIFLGQFSSPLLAQPIIAAFGPLPTFGLIAAGAAVAGVLFLIFAFTRTSAADDVVAEAR